MSRRIHDMSSDGAAASAPANGATSSGRPHHARADCTADGAGGLTFDVRFFDRNDAETPAPYPPERAAVLLRPRHHSGPDDGLRLPLGRSGAGGRLRATLPSTAGLREGRWDAYLAWADEEPQRLLPGVVDLRSLVDRVPVDTHTGLVARIPYTTKYGNLTVRAWHRRPHAEAGALHVEDGAMALEGRLYGARLSTAAQLEARSRDASVSPVRVPVRRESEDEAGVSAAPGDGDSDGDGDGGGGGHPGSGFTAELPFGPLVPGDQVWDLWVRPSDDEEPVRLARILDDVPDKKRIFRYPSRRVAGPDGAVHSVRPYYTVNNNLSVEVSSKASEE
ncbi:hypothetical protein [Streptomyces sp. 891-h]|uniref:hypothetical protein n=1 Tax=Streptomyces sp. 891-h TaxID=2720714 RepID=UPI001FA9A86F|nr:hypothetical protein [Streptomyces sp. 891-h]UNZ20238.1 hypothetical protein HC362_27470 [Streptomyces sp. 891-h]